MKKLTTIIALIFFSGVLFAQEEPVVVTWEGLIKQKEKSDAEIANAKKSENPKTWIKRANTYYDIYSFVIKNLYKGMPAKGNGIQNVEYLVGKPGKILQEGNTEIWVYNRKKVYFIDGLVDHWEQTEFIDKDALTKSAEALLKAVELDDKDKGKLKDKSTTKILNGEIKNTVIDDAIGYYQQKDYNKAYDLMKYGYKLCLLPKNEADTAYSADQIQYFEGVIAFNAKKYKDAEKHFEKSIQDNYEPGISYHYLAESYREDGEEEKFINTVKEGFQKHPEEEQLIIDLINYYLRKNEEHKAIEYIDIAIQKNPDNPSYYSAKATIFDNKTDTLAKLYNKYMEEAYEYKKEAFRNRNNSKLKAESQGKRDVALAEAMKQFSEIEANVAKAEELYNKSLNVKPKFFNAAYNLGRLDLKLNDLYAKHADWLLKIYINKDFQKSAEFETKSKEYLNSASKKFEKALEIQPKDRDLLETLKRIYYKMHDKENLDRIDKRIEELGEKREKIK